MRNLTSLISFFVLLLSMPATAFPESATIPGRDVGSNPSTILQMVPLVIVGEGWSQKIILQNVDEQLTVRGMVVFSRQDGSLWRIPIKITNAAGTFDYIDNFYLFDLAVGSMVMLETNVSYGPQELGVAYVLNSEYGVGRFVGQTIYRKQVAGRPDLTTSIPLAGLATDWLTIPFDNTDGKYPGVGVAPLQFTAGAEGSPLVYAMYIRTIDGSVDRMTSRQAPLGGLDWFSLVHEYPETAGKAGVIRIEVPPSGGHADPLEDRLFLSAVSLQFTQNGAFSGITTYEKGDVLSLYGGDPR